MSTPERRAYQDAWTVRQRTGDESHGLLLDKFREHGANPVWSDPGEELHRWLVNCWDRGVSPHRLGVESLKQIGKLVPRVVKPFGELLRQLR